MGKKPFIDRKNARHFHLVHRSQKDPLISDHEASSRVLVEVVPTNLRGKNKQIEYNDIDDIDDQQRKDEIESRVGKAALYGIHFDDTEYNYLQHLKPIGENEGGAIFIEAPKREKREKKKGGNIELKKGDDELEDNKDASSTSKKDRKVRILLPEEVLPSKEELPVGLLNQSAIPEDIQGFLPDMDPRLRETLEALEDDEYVENDLDDEFFSALNAENNEFYEEQEEDFEPEEEIENWESEFKKFKNRIKKSEDEDDYYEDDKRSRTTGGYSMTSSIMFRNDKLRLLDEQFEKIEKEYTEVEEDIESDDKSTSSSQIRQDFSQILDEFLDKYEISGCKIVQKLEGDNVQDQLETVRRSLGKINLNDGVSQDNIINEKDGSGSDKSENNRSKNQKKSRDRLVQVESIKKEAWDCQSILSTYSNFENHPILIREIPHQKINISQKSGLPVLESSVENKEKDNDEEGIKIKMDEKDQIKVNIGAARSKNESKEEKKLRKQINKDEKKNRRVEKKSLKRAFAKERTKQNKISHDLSQNHSGAIHLD